MTKGVCALLLCALPASAQVFPLTENSWSNPEFRERFMGTYQVESDISPSISPSEKTLFEEIAPLVSSSPRGAIGRLQSAITQESSAAFDFILGNLYYQESDMAGAVRAYEAAIRKFPNYYKAYLNAGRAKVNLGDYDSGLTMLQKALEIQAGDGSLYGLIGYCYLNREQYSSALDAYRMAGMLAPKSRDWKLGKLQCLIALEKSDEAIGMLYELIVAEPSNADWWKFQANQFVNQGETLKAAANLSVVKEMGKADMPTLVLLGDILLNEGVYGAALESYEAAIGTGRIQPDRILRVIQNLLILGEVDRGEALLDTLVQSAGDLEESHELQILNLRAQVSLASGDSEGAAEHLKAVVERDPMNGQALLSLSKYYQGEGDMAQAEFYAENAAKVPAVAHKALLSLAQIKVKQRDYREAARYLREAQEMQPQDYVANYLMKVEQAALRM